MGKHNSRRLNDLEARITEVGGFLAFRVSDDGEDYQPIMMRLHRRSEGMLLVEIEDEMVLCRENDLLANLEFNTDD